LRARFAFLLAFICLTLARNVGPFIVSSVKIVGVVDGTNVDSRIFHMEYSNRNITKVKRAKITGTGFDPKGLGMRIRKVRAEQRQQEFADLIGVSQGQLSKMERGIVTPSAETLLQLSEISGRSVDWLLKG
jgi:DNA-binding XRE family transcriptional regulator